MWVTSEFGFYPQVVIWVAAVILVLWLLGYRWEAASTLFAAAGNAGLETVVKRWVVRPRPDPDLVHVMRNLDGLQESFPAGHVMANVAIMGFLIYLLWTFARPSALRTLTILFLSSQIVLIGVSRIYEGEHWFTDVLGGYLLGVLLLAATCAFYHWGRARFSPANRRRG
jgi:undecaprenyl-diphosphatase